MPELLVAADDDLPAGLLAATRAMVESAFDGRFAEEDWRHCDGGTRVIALEAGLPVGHAAVVPRTLWVAGTALRTGYVEGVATATGRHGQGIGSLLMAAIDQLVRDGYDLGALSTGRHSFYGRLGWERWQGPTFVRADAGDVRTPDEDDGVMVLRHGPTADLDLTAPITCPERPGDDW